MFAPNTDYFLFRKVIFLPAFFPHLFPIKLKELPKGWSLDRTATGPHKRRKKRSDAPVGICTVAKRGNGELDCKSRLHRLLAGKCNDCLFVFTWDSICKLMKTLFYDKDNGGHAIMWT